MKWHIILRAALYMALAGLPVFITFFTDLTNSIKEGKPMILHWSVWVLLGLNSSYQMLLVLRSYLDGSAHRERTGTTQMWSKATVTMLIGFVIAGSILLTSCSRDTNEYVWTGDQVYALMVTGWPEGWCPVETKTTNRFWVRTLEGKNIKPPTN